MWNKNNRQTRMGNACDFYKLNLVYSLDDWRKMTRDYNAISGVLESSLYYYFFNSTNTICCVNEERYIFALEFFNSNEYSFEKNQQMLWTFQKAVMLATFPDISAEKKVSVDVPNEISGKRHLAQTMKYCRRDGENLEKSGGDGGGSKENRNRCLALTFYCVFLV